MAGGVRIGVAWDDPTLEATPVWSYLTDDANLVASYMIDRGRQFEFDRTDTGTAKVEISDVDGLLDPTNTGGVFYGKIEPLLQIQIELWNPVTSVYKSRYRGFIEDFDYGISPTQRVTRLRISCVDLFAILTAIEMQPDGTFGDGVVDGNIFFDNATFQDRISQVLGNAGIPSAFFVVFTGNINCAEYKYAPSENVLQVVEDAVDAEFPTVSNLFCDRYGRLCAHGRLAKFDPVTVSAGAGDAAWDYQEWKCGDGAAVAASISDTAHIRSLGFNRGLSKVFNQALCTPNGIVGTDIPGQVSTDPTSIAKYGIRSWSSENLLIAAPTGDALTAPNAGSTTGNNALDETKLYADYIVANYADPQNRVSELSFKSMAPDDARAPANWKMITECDIADTVSLTETSPGGGGFVDEDFFIEGVHETATPLAGDYAAVTLTLDISPRIYFADPGDLFG